MSDEGDQKIILPLADTPPGGPELATNIKIAVQISAFAEMLMDDSPFMTFEYRHIVHVDVTKGKIPKNPFEPRTMMSINIEKGDLTIREIVMPDLKDLKLVVDPLAKKINDEMMTVLKKDEIIEEDMSVRRIFTVWNGLEGPLDRHPESITKHIRILTE
jgi:hypothetical protein